VDAFCAWAVWCGISGMLNHIFCVQILQCAAQHLWCVCLVCKADVSGSTEY
jgi:hypothetical protein